MRWLPGRKDRVGETETATEPVWTWRGRETSQAGAKAHGREIGYATGSLKKGGRLSSKWVRRWGPVLLGAIAIWILSTELFSDQNTARVIVPALHWLFPWMTPRMLHLGHAAIRKLAHVCVYFIFGVLLLRAIRGDQKGWHWGWAFAAIALAAGYATIDEIHQAFTATRHPSVRDVMLDAVGALAAQLALWTHQRWSENGREKALRV